MRCKMQSLCLAMLLFCFAASAEPLLEVSQNHWAYGRLEQLGNLLGVDFTHKPSMGGATRLDVAQNILDLLGQSRQQAGSLLLEEDWRDLEKIVREFKAELELLGAKSGEIIESLDRLEEAAEAEKKSGIGWSGNRLYTDAKFTYGTSRIYNYQTGEPIWAGIIDSEYPWETSRRFPEVVSLGSVSWQLKSQLVHGLSLDGMVQMSHGYGALLEDETSQEAGSELKGGEVTIPDSRFALTYRDGPYKVVAGYFETRFSPFTLDDLWWTPRRFYGLQFTGPAGGWRLETFVGRHRQADDPYTAGLRLSKRVSTVWNLGFNRVESYSLDPESGVPLSVKYVSSVNWNANFRPDWSVNGELALSSGEKAPLAFSLESAHSWPDTTLTLNYRYTDQNFTSSYGEMREEYFKPGIPDKWFSHLNEASAFRDKQRLRLYFRKTKLPGGFGLTIRNNYFVELPKPQKSLTHELTTYFGLDLPQLAKLTSTVGIWREAADRKAAAGYEGIDRDKYTFVGSCRWLPLSQLRLAGTYMLGKAYDAKMPGQVETSIVQYLNWNWRLSQGWSLSGRYKAETKKYKRSQYVTITTQESWLAYALDYYLNSESKVSLGRLWTRNTQNSWIRDNYTASLTVKF